MQASYTNWIQSSFSHQYQHFNTWSIKDVSMETSTQGCANQVTVATKFLYDGA
jgi:hypothetical protein